MLPSVPCGGSENTEVSNQWLGSPVISDAGSTPAWTFGRSSPDVLPLRDQFEVAIDGEKGRPLRSDTIELTCQPPRKGLPLKNGTCQVPLAEKTWRTSNAAGAQSALTLYGLVG